MHRTMLKSKQHRVTATHADRHYEGSCAIDENLLATTDIRAERGSGIIPVNGSAARRAAPGDILIIASFAQYTELELARYEPTRVYVDERNRMQEQRQQIPIQMAG